MQNQKNQIFYITKTVKTQSTSVIDTKSVKLDIKSKSKKNHISKKKIQEKSNNEVILKFLIFSTYY